MITRYEDADRSGSILGEESITRNLPQIVPHLLAKEPKRLRTFVQRPAASNDHVNTSVLAYAYDVKAIRVLDRPIDGALLEPPRNLNPVA
jgi:hypothetical protein